MEFADNRAVRIRTISVAVMLLMPGMVLAQVEASTTVETYFNSGVETRGWGHALSWAESNIRLSPQWRATFSYTRFSNRDTYDEVCLAYYSGSDMVRVGRLRTAFGFSNWSELFYNGFNARPLVRILALTEAIRLTRNDVGVEWTTGPSSCQFQIALLDSQVEPKDVKFKELRSVVTRLQTQQANFIYGLDVLAQPDTKQSVYGLDLRGTWPYLQVRAEAFAGAGPGRCANGYYVDASYRLPGFTRTQVVARTEGFSPQGSQFNVHTLGVRQLIGTGIGLNLNYAWSDGDRPRSLGTRFREGWTLLGTYRVTF